MAPEAGTLGASPRSCGAGPAEVEVSAAGSALCGAERHRAAAARGEQRCPQAGCPGRSCVARTSHVERSENRSGRSPGVLGTPRDAGIPSAPRHRPEPPHSCSGPDPAPRRTERPRGPPELRQRPLASPRRRAGRGRSGLRAEGGAEGTTRGTALPPPRGAAAILFVVLSPRAARAHAQCRGTARRRRAAPHAAAAGEAEVPAGQVSAAAVRVGSDAGFRAAGSRSTRMPEAPRGGWAAGAERRLRRGGGERSGAVPAGSGGPGLGLLLPAGR